MKYCTNCGNEIDDAAVVCVHCGVATNPAFGTSFNPSWKTKSKVAAGVLAILLGSLGVHKFYMDKIGLGIVYLIFCWTGIPGIIGIVEGIMYLVMSNEEFSKKYSVNVQ
ncbi:MAG: zinc-ribbon domain and TM2 domain-containing protein [Lachnospiraceae bacterium]